MHHGHYYGSSCHCQSLCVLHLYIHDAQMQPHHSDDVHHPSLSVLNLCKNHGPYNCAATKMFSVNVLPCVWPSLLLWGVLCNVVWTIILSEVLLAGCFGLLFQGGTRCGTWKQPWLTNRFSRCYDLAAQVNWPLWKFTMSTFLAASFTANNCFLYAKLNALIGETNYLCIDDLEMPNRCHNQKSRDP